MLYSSKDITSRLKGVSLRQLVDLAEKGYVVPARETTGAGSPRLYSFTNIFEIAVCVAIRGRIPTKDATKEFITNVLDTIRGETKRAQSIETEEQKALKVLLKASGIQDQVLKPEPPPPFDLLYIALEADGCYHFRPISSTESFGEVMTKTKRYKPQNFCGYVLDIKALWDFLKVMF